MVQWMLLVHSFLLNLGMTQSQVDPALNDTEKKGGDRSTGFNHWWIMHCGQDSFNEEVMGRLRQKFVSGKVAEGEFRYVRFDIKQNPDGVVLDQSHYLQKLKIFIIKLQGSKQKEDPLGKEELSIFRGLVGKLNWAAQGTRPDVVFEVVELSSKFKQATVNDWIRADKCALQLKEKPAYILFPH